MFLSEYPIQTVPTGLFSVPPLGPAIPLVEIPIDELNFFLTLVAISSTTSLLTAPNFSMFFLFTFKLLIFILLLYATTLPEKYLELPGMEVTKCER